MSEMDDTQAETAAATGRGVIYSLGFPGRSLKRYVGSAINMKQRMRSHTHLLRKGRHHSRAFQNAANKYGIQNIRIDILESDLPAERLIEREQIWIDKFMGELYNKSPTAASRLGATMSAESRAKISESLKGNQRRKGIPHSIEIRQIIGSAVKLANAEGRRKQPSPHPQNFAEFNRAVKAGEIIPSWAKPERNIEILASYRRTKSMAETGTEFGITMGAVSYVIRKLLKTPKGKRSRA